MTSSQCYSPLLLISSLSLSVMQEGAPGCGGRAAPDPFPGNQPAGIADIYGFIIREHHFLSPNLAG